MPHFAVLECIAIVFTLIVIKTGMAQPNSEEQGADVYQLARTSARPNTLIEITNRLTVPMVLLKKDLQFHGHTPLRPAPWNIDPMNFDAFLVSPLWFNKTGTYLSVYGAMVYEIREDQRSIAFALYFSVPDGHAQHRFPWFGLEIYANDFERRMRDALEADYKPEGGVTTLNSYYCRFSYASAQKTLKVDNADYKIIANMKMTSNTTATIKVSVQPSRQYRGAPRAPIISQPVAPIQVQILTSTSTSSASTAAPVEETTLSPSTDASTHASVAQSEATSTSEKSSSSSLSTSQVTEAGPTADEMTTIFSSLSTVEASSSGDTSTVLPTTTAQAQDVDETVTSTHEAASTTTQEEEDTTSKSSTTASKDTQDHTSTVTEHVSSSQSDQESTTIIQTSSTTTESNEDESSTSTTEAVDPTTTTTPPTNPAETMTDCDYDCIGEAQPQ